MEMEGYFHYGIMTPRGLYLREVNYEGHSLRTKRLSCARGTVKKKITPLRTGDCTVIFRILFQSKGMLCQQLKLANRSFLKCRVRLNCFSQHAECHLSAVVTSSHAFLFSRSNVSKMKLCFAGLWGISKQPQSLLHQRQTKCSSRKLKISSIYQWEHQQACFGKS